MLEISNILLNVLYNCEIHSLMWIPYPCEIFDRIFVKYLRSSSLLYIYNLAPKKSRDDWFLLHLQEYNKGDSIYILLIFSVHTII